MSTEPLTFPLSPVDAKGRALAVGDVVAIQSVKSCVTELPEEDKSRLFALVGQRRVIVQFDHSGFVWLSFSSSQQGADFCLLPSEPSAFALGIAAALATAMRVSLQITNLLNAASATRKALPCATVTGTSITIQSQLGSEEPLNEHLVWLWGMLKHERRYLKGLQAEGAIITVQANGTRGSLVIKPNGAEMLHLLGASLVIGEK